MGQNISKIQDIIANQNPSQISDLKPGDHIYTKRAAATYLHHGIYIGEEMVIHLIPGPTQKSRFISSASAVSSRRGKVCPNPKCGHNPERDGGIVKTCLTCFLQGDRVNIYVFIYGATLDLLVFKSRLTPLPAEQVVQRAIKLYEEKTTFGDYNVLVNNCEHFAIYCKTNVRLSKQISGNLILPGNLTT